MRLSPGPLKTSTSGPDQFTSCPERRGAAAGGTTAQPNNQSAEIKDNTQCQVLSNGLCGLALSLSLFPALRTPPIDCLGSQIVEDDRGKYKQNSKKSQQLTMRGGDEADGWNIMLLGAGGGGGRASQKTQQ